LLHSHPSSFVRSFVPPLLRRAIKPAAIVTAESLSITGTTSFERFGGTTSTRLDLLTLPRAPESIARGAVLGAAMIGARSLAIARPPPVLMTGGRDAVFTRPDALLPYALAPLPVVGPAGRPSFPASRGAGAGQRGRARGRRSCYAGGVRLRRPHRAPHSACCSPQRLLYVRVRGGGD
jgi:hypothetical protein